MTEEAERVMKLNSLEKSMLTELKTSVVGKASRFASLWAGIMSRFASLWAGIIDGVPPALAAVVCLAPFFLSLIPWLVFDQFRNSTLRRNRLVDNVFVRRVSWKNIK